MKKVIIVFKLFLLIYTAQMKAQVTQEWISTYQGKVPGGYFADKASVDKSGNFVIAGRGGTDNTDYLVLKYSSSGNLLWERRYNGIANSQDWFRDMILDDSGNVYVTGNSFEGAENGNINFVTLKYSPDGELRWQKSLDWVAHKEDVPFSITLDNQNNVYVAGYGWALPLTFQNFDMLVVKYNNDGVEQWIRSYGNPTLISDWGYSVVADDSDNVYLSGYCPASTTIKYDSSGNQKWVREFPRLSGEYASPLFSKIDKQNNIIISGRYDNDANYITLKYDRNGNFQWSMPFWYNSILNVINAIYIDSNSNVYSAGRSQTAGNGHDALIVKYAPDGDTLWARFYDDGIGEDDEAIAITCDSIGNVYLTGSTYRDSHDFLTLKYSANGNLIFSKKYSIPGNNTAFGIGLDRYNNIFIAGSKDLAPFGSAVVAIKYSQFTGIETSIHSQRKDYQLYQNYPNPFNPSTIINYQLSMFNFASLKVYGVLGNEVALLVNEKKNAGSYQVEFEGSNFPSGIYFYSLYMNSSLIDTKRMLLIK